MFAGPNGSGKSTIFNQIESSPYDIGVYLNADDLEVQLKTLEFIELNKFGIHNINPQEFYDFIEKHSLKTKALNDGYPINLFIDNNKIINSSKKSHSYEAAILVDFIRDRLLNAGKKISFETVMSHNSKIDILKKSKGLGYKNYLYFISTESEKINIERVKLRVQMGGHPVENDKIKKRYYDSLKLLKSAVEQTYRSFIFDNSGIEPILILEVFEGNDITYHHEDIPNWVDQYLINV